MRLMLVPLSLNTRVTSALTENEWLSLFESEFLVMLLIRSSPSEEVDCWLSLVLSLFDLLKFPPHAQRTIAHRVAIGAGGCRVLVTVACGEILLAI